MSLSRRALLGGAAIVVPPMPKSVTVEMEWTVNPFRQRFEGDARVKLSDILYCEFIKQRGQDTCPDNWFEVLTKDGRRIQTELLRNQTGVLHMMHEMKTLGVTIHVIDVEARNREALRQRKG